MAQPQEEGYISKGITENQFLPPLQKSILLFLAENHPQSRYRTTKLIKGYYKSVWKAFDDLQEKKVIVEVEEKEYRNRKHSLFWLTPGGDIRCTC